jgi:hypothetical protein
MDHRIEDGIITSPGASEGEPHYVPYYWETGLDGIFSFETASDDDPPLAFGFNLDASDHARFPELLEGQVLLVWSDDQGFVHHKIRA